MPLCTVPEPHEEIDRFTSHPRVPCEALFLRLFVLGKQCWPPALPTEESVGAWMTGLLDSHYKQQGETATLGQMASIRIEVPMESTSSTRLTGSGGRLGDLGLD